MSLIEIRQTTNKGRGVFSTADIKSGTVLSEESPLISCQFPWNAAYAYLACEYCLRPLETAECNVRRLTNDFTINLPYPECCPTQNQLEAHTKCSACSEMYCSEQCLENALKYYHKVLCRDGEKDNKEHAINKIVEFWKKIHYPPETSSITLILKIIGMFKQCDDVSELHMKFKDFVSETTNEDLMICHKLLGENFADQINQLYSLITVAFDTASDERLQWFTLTGFQSLLAMVGTNGQGIGTSSFADWVRNVSEMDLTEKQRKSVDVLIDNLYTKLDDVVGSFLNNEGSALYSNQSKVNHSCAPNAECRFPYSNNVLALTTVRDIRKGEEICISYLDECSLERSRHSRQKKLLENYLFLCQCDKCEMQVNDADETSDDEDEEEDEEMDDSE
ncbi:histone-lysine N-trimethyltransferase SMYD5 [Toxorhynchites rutilus septentrionalis]|uniref:histone-lysine N-trimethyltransferase SMYD5 n=1 Tax=Toxorhynchites rutilus septentrionalis TaxID=329112 RepID=UPI00247982AC|nr:histone-lysine N-trimethyltransferase SMYD5 [Toxorhynchites rutilus septentrionalis]